jgi:sigma-B regulation protein RsbU (phosphoserine phosphatase)
LPEKLPQPQGWELAAYFHPSLDVGGDLYDAFYLNGSKFLGLVLGDVCDKGVGAAIFMMLLRSLVRAFAGIDADNDPCKPLSYGVSRTNEYIATHHQSLNMFATLFFAVLDPQTGKLAYINAGHPPVLLCNQWGIRAELKPTGPAVGVFPDAQFDIQHVQIQPGEMLFAYTDGVTDARNANGQSFTQERLFALLHPLAPSAQKFIDRICKAISNHSTQNTYFDDIAMLVAQRKSS